METLLYQYKPWWEETANNTGIQPGEKYLSELRKYLKLKQIVVLTGLRRVGKTTLMKLLNRRANKGRSLSKTYTVVCKLSPSLSFASLKTA